MKSLSNPWHVNNYRDNLLKTSYIEWKYFNFSSKHLSGIFVYLITDPLNVTGIGGGRVIARIFTDKKVFGGVNRIPIKEIAFSSRNAEIKIGGNHSIDVIGNNYIIKGKQKEVSWNLKYSPLLPSVTAFSKMSLDFLGLEKASWEIKMPKADVRGVVKIGKRTLPVRSLGYSDANWGNVIPLVTDFNWFQYNDDKISIVMGETQNVEIGKKKIGHWAKAYITFNKEKIIFPDSEVNINHTKWFVVPGTDIKVPSLVSIQAQNRHYNLLLQVYMLRSDLMRFRMPFFIPVRPVTAEQPAIFSGNLFKKVGGSLKPLHGINGKGFMEYTLRDIEFFKKPLKAGVLV